MLNLTPRHQAMLQAMGVMLWVPDVPQRTKPLSPSQPDAVALPVHDAMPAPQPAVAPRTPSPEPRPVAVRAPAATPAATPAKPATDTPEVWPPIPADLPSRSWAELQATVADCRSCRLCEQRHQAVFGVGTAPSEAADPVSVDWLIVGEGPGEQEDLQGEPFVGAAGKLLDQMLLAMGLQRRRDNDSQPSVYITNVVKCRPPGNRNPLPDEMETCSVYLQEQIRRLKPKFILALGRFAAHNLLQGTVPDVQAQALGKLRASVHRHGDIPVVVSYHPAYLLRNPVEKAKTWDDLCLALAAHPLSQA